jgi:putative hydroxymethylpyrimidine transport system permease protein
MNLMTRGLIVVLSLFLMWQLLVMIFQLPPFILPTPWLVLKTGYLRFDLILQESWPTIIETLFGLSLGIFLGCIAALSMAFFRPFTWWLLPVLVISQAIPTFAIAPLFVIWFGYGMTSKIATTILMLFFPVTSAFFDGLRRTEPGWLDLAKTMNASKWRIFWHIRIPAALPNLATGIRVATVVAPIGAVVGEWVGASKGLGFLMLNANARMQIDLMFAALFVIVLFSLTLYFFVDQILKYFINWQVETK